MRTSRLLSALCVAPFCQCNVLPKQNARPAMTLPLMALSCQPRMTLPAMALDIKELHEWADTMGVDRAVNIGTSQFGGRGLLASKAVQSLQPLLSVPEELTLSTQRESPSGEHWATRLAMSLHDLCESDSPPPHVLALPEPPKVLHNWDAVALAELQNETLAAEALKWRATRAAEYSIIADEDTRMDEQRFFGLYDLVQSRVIGARGDHGDHGENGDTLRIVPLIDMAQHSSCGGQFTFRNGKMTLLAGRAMEESEECFLDYGDRTNDEFALQYGFVPERNNNDMVTVHCYNRDVTVTWDHARDADPEVRDACAALLESMPTSLPKDVQLLREDTGESEERLIALRYRIAKKQVPCAASAIHSSRVLPPDVLLLACPPVRPYLHASLSTSTPPPRQLLHAMAGHPAASAATSAFAVG